MEEKKIEIAIPPDVQVLCDLFGIAPDELLTRFMNDLCSMAGNGGSDERRMAKQYFMRSDLSSCTVFNNDFAEEILEDYELIYQSAYPATGNTGWEQQRRELLVEMYEDWKKTKEKIGE